MKSLAPGWQVMTLFTYRLTDIALPTASDERLLFDDATNDEVLDRLRSWGIREIALKRDSNGSKLAALVVQHRGAIIPRDAMQLES